MKRYHVWCSIKGLVVEDDPNGELVYYDAVAARISELEAQLAAKDEELRLNDEAWEIHHKDCCEELGDLQQQLSAMTAERDSLQQQLAAAQERTMAIRIIFDGPPGPDAGQFVEVETDTGESISIGEWIDRKDGYWALRIAKLPAPPEQED